VEAARRTEPHRPVTSLIREFLDDALHGEGETDLDSLVTRAWQRFADDDEFFAALLDDALPLLLADQLRWLANERRAVLLSSGRVLTEAGIDGRAREMMSRTLESVGDGHRKALLKLNRPEGEHVLAIYDQRIAGLSRYRNMVGELVAGLRNDEETIGERYSNIELDTIWSKHLAGGTA
jgi:hypothetical protein